MKNYIKLIDLLIPPKLRFIILFLKNFYFGIEFFNILFKYCLNNLFPEKSDLEHLEASISWLVRAQSVRKEDFGVSAIYYLKNGWDLSYPETSGYIIATFIAYADLFGKSEYVEKAILIGDWEIEIQAPSGGVYSRPDSKNIASFNTGQVILGWCLLFEKTSNRKYLEAAQKAGDFLVRTQDEEGNWPLGSFSGAKTYESRVDWALIRLAKLSNNSDYLVAARKNLKWVVSNQKDNGWFKNCGFKNEHPITHTIVYTLRGLLECALLAEDIQAEFNLFKIVFKGVDALCTAVDGHWVNDIKGLMPRAFDENWVGVTSDSCLTGNVQFAVLLFRLASLTDEKKKYLEIANLIVSASKRMQVVETNFLDIKGALPGSYPIYYGYMRNAYPNWSTKFMSDALMMKIEFNQKMFIKA